MSPSNPHRRTWAGRIAAPAIRFYQRFLSPLKPPTCRFHPSCSAYTLEALELHGAWRGSRLSVWRILRCQPFCKGGFDPVPDSTRHSTGRACDSPADVDTPAHDASVLHEESNAPSRNP